jgi:hypothetical protein
MPIVIALLAIAGGGVQAVPLPVRLTLFAAPSASPSSGPRAAGAFSAPDWR